MKYSIAAVYSIPSTHLPIYGVEFTDGAIFRLAKTQQDPPSYEVKDFESSVDELSQVSFSELSDVTIETINNVEVEDAIEFKRLQAIADLTE